jgi:hypothetical protein
MFLEVLAGLSKGLSKGSSSQSSFPVAVVANVVCFFGLGKDGSPPKDISPIETVNPVFSSD